MASRFARLDGDAPTPGEATRASPALVGALAALVALVTGGLHATPYDNYVRLARAFLAGRVWIDWPGPYIDALAHAGRRYVIEAPVPALLLMAPVARFGAAANQTLLGVALAGVATGAAWSLLGRLRVDAAARPWLTLFFFAGTDLWWCASLGDVWFLAHVAAVAATMLALDELAGPRRPWLVALWGCLAAGSRFSLVLALPVYFAMLLDRAPLAALAPARRAIFRPIDELARGRVVVPFATVVGVAALAWVGYNQARWGVPYDIGYAEWYRQDAAGGPEGSPFQLRYLGYELRAFFLALPEALPRAPWLTAPIEGQGLPFTSPALVLAFFARAPRRTLIALWAATALVAAPSFLYYVDGFAQFGMRHALDFEPFLFALMALGARRGMAWWGRLLCAWSAAVGAWGVWYWHAVLGRPTV